MSAESEGSLRRTYSRNCCLAGSHLRIPQSEEFYAQVWIRDAARTV